MLSRFNCQKTIDKVKVELAQSPMRKIISQCQSETEKHLKRGEVAYNDKDDALKGFQKALLLREIVAKKRHQDSDDSNRIANCCDQIGLTDQSMRQSENALEFLGKRERIRRPLVERNPKDSAWQRNLAWSLG
jgi:hypothetical protein